MRMYGTTRCVVATIAVVVLFNCLGAFAGEQVFYTDFSKAGTDAWELKNATPEFVDDADATAGKLMVVKSDNLKRTQMVKIPLNVEQLKDKQIIITIRYKVEQLEVNPDKQYAGAKAFCITARGEKRNYFGASEKASTDWKEVSQKTMTLNDLQSAVVSLGFQGASGVLKVDYIKVEVK